MNRLCLSGVQPVADASLSYRVGVWVELQDWTHREDMDELLSEFALSPKQGPLAIAVGAAADDRLHALQEAPRENSHEVVTAAEDERDAVLFA